MIGTLFDSDPNIFHFVTSLCALACIIIRGSVSGFSSRTQVLLFSCYVCNVLVCKWTSSYWWNHGVVFTQSLICEPL